MAVNIRISSAWRTLLITAIFLSVADAQPRAKLDEETARAFDQYVENVERLLDKRSRGALSFLWLDENPKLRNQALRGRIPVEQLDEELHIEVGWSTTGSEECSSPTQRLRMLSLYFRTTTTTPTYIRK